jgi:antitoxin (DNA-binding transcriptional repressor) of toxin-antitoxin stability system
MQITNIYGDQTYFSRLIERVIAGEEIIIGKAGKPVAKLIPLSYSTFCPM